MGCRHNGVSLAYQRLTSGKPFGEVTVVWELIVMMFCRDTNEQGYLLEIYCFAIRLQTSGS